MMSSEEKRDVAKMTLIGIVAMVAYMILDLNGMGW